MHVTVMGLGLFGGGVGAARYFAENGHEVTVTDIRSTEVLAESVARLEGLGIRFVLSGHEPDIFTSCELLVVNPAIKPNNKFVDMAASAGAKITTEFELGLKEAIKRGARVVAVTGSNGKTTTSGMLHAMLRQIDERTLIGGNWGGSLLELTENIAEGTPLVLEVSSFQMERLGEAEYFEAAAITNLAPNHLDWHGDCDNYYDSKWRVAKLLKNSAGLVLNYNDDEIKRRAAELDRTVVTPVWFGRDIAGEENYVQIEADELKVSCGGDVLSLPLPASDILRGEHDVYNLAAAVGLLCSIGLDGRKAIVGLKEFTHEPHRLQLIATDKNIRFVDDSACTTPESAISAINSAMSYREENIVLLMGGADKRCDFTELVNIIKSNNVDVVCMGEAGERLAEILETSEIRNQVADNLQDGFNCAVSLLKDKGGTLMFSPAAASFGEFKNYHERGKAFKKLAESFIKS